MLHKESHRVLHARGPSTKAVRRSAVLLSVVITVAILSMGLALPDHSTSGKASVNSAYMLPVPVADAGKNITTRVNKTVHFDGSLSAPSDGATITDYNWTFTYLNEDHELHGAYPEFTFTETTPTGLAVLVTLNVTDSNGLNDTDTLWVFVRYAPPTWLEKYWLDAVLVTAIVVILAYYSSIGVRRLVKREPLVTEAGREKFWLSMAKGKKIMGQLIRNPMGLIGMIVLGFFIFMGAFGPTIAPFPVNNYFDWDHVMEVPSKTHWLGTDNFGRDIFSELLYGAQTSIIVGIISAVIASFLGAAVGLYSGYVGGWKDEAVMRLNDVVLSIPWLVLMIIVAAFIGKIDLTGIILIIGLTGWSTTARMVRAQVLSVKERQYIERARCIGSSEMSIIRRHIFPNTFPLIFANTILTVAVSILSEATLSFLGLRPSGVVTWGTMLSYANEYDAFSNGLEWWTLAPGLSIVGVVLGFTLLGYALDEILNPKLRHR